MSKTFSSSYSNLILSNHAYNPVHVASSATITGTATALYGTGIVWTVTNAGTISGGSAASDSGIWLHAGGLITNTSSGTITGDYSIRLSHGGTVVNYGSVGGVGTAFPKAIMIAYGGAVTNHASAVISGGGGIYFGISAGTVVNAGLIIATAAVAPALNFDYGGLVNNLSTGTISAGSTAIYLGNSGLPGIYGTLINDGLISATAVGFADVFMGAGSVTNMSNGQILGTTFGIQIQSAPATVINAGSIGVSTGQALALLDGAYVTNSASGNISGYSEAIYVTGLPGTVLNSGIIQGSIETGIWMIAGGTVSNASSATITGRYDGVDLANGGTVTNGGTIAGTTGNGVYVSGTAGVMINSAGGTLTGGSAGILLRNGAYANNAGYVYGNNYGADTDASLLTNQAGGVVKGGSGGIYLGGGTLINSGSVVSGNRNGVYAGYAGGVVTNQSGGQIIGYDYGIKIRASSTIVNDGTISYSGTHGAAIDLFSGGVITNQSAGLITFATGIEIGGSAGTVVNAGAVSATTGAGIYMSSGGSVTNLAGGIIAGGIFGSGVQIEHGGTVANAGTIEATAGNDAVYLPTGYTNLLVVDPGAVFVGFVNGGDPVGGTVSSTLELGSSTIAGTLSSLGSQYINFDDVVVDPGATWTFAGSSAIYSGVTMTNSGSVYGPVVMQANAVLTNASSGTISGSSYAVDGSGGGILVDNAGVLTSTSKAVRLSGGGTVDNRTTGTIQGGYAVLFDGAPGTVDNAGHITGTSIGVYLYGGGQFTNEASGTVGGGQALSVGNGMGTAVNAGTLSGYSAGILLNNGGAVTNQSSGFITATANGGYGIVIRGGAGTVINAGSIAGYHGVAFTPGFANRLALYPGGSISGPVDGGNTIGSATISTLELASGASTGTLNGLGSHYLDFAQVTVDAGANWTLSGSPAIIAGETLTVLSGASVVDTGDLSNDGGIVLDPSTMLVGNLTGAGAVTIGNGSTLEVQGSNSDTIAFAGGTGYLHLDTPDSASGSVTNFAIGDTIDLKGIDATSVSLSSGSLQFAGGSFALPGVGAIQATPSSDGAEVSVLCFCANTLIQTPGGQVAVQHLGVGDPVVTLSGISRRIVWIGTGKVLATRGHRTAATPVIVRKGALVDNVPNRDLHLTKGHSLYLDGALIPIESLVNHRSIVWDDRAQEVELYHIELESHDVLIANGAPAESYRDDGNRWLFRNANAGWDAAAQAPCAPILAGGPLVDAMWRRLLDRAGPRPGIPTTNEPDLHLLVDGQRVDAMSQHGEAYVFALHALPEEVRIMSRAAAPDQLGVARDPRVLGIALRQLVLRHGKQFRVIEAEDRRLAAGFHAFEPQGGLRWTNGDAELPMAMFRGFGGAMELVLHVGCTSTYLLEAEASIAA